ncbi:RNA polymerase sigma-70 factor, ECF subfamily [bacterium A37T11]|nr:RNA polymerase sigma-70 factor, ECF subfamily [bacterium A37T11]
MNTLGDYLLKAKSRNIAFSDASYSFEQQQEILQRAIDQLPEKRRQVYLLSTEEELSLDEIAARMNISRYMVKKQLYAARDAIKEYMTIHLGLMVLICNLALMASAS